MGLGACRGHGRADELLTCHLDVAVDHTWRADGFQPDETALVSDSWERGDACEQYVGRFSRQLAPVLLSWLRPFAEFDGSGRPLLGGQGPAPACAMSLDQAARERLRDRLRARIPFQADGSISLTARAWAVRASVPG